VRKSARILVLVYVFSLAFFDKAGFFGYDSPWMWVGLACFAWVLTSRGPGAFRVPRAFFLWHLFMIVLLAPAVFSASPEQVLLDVVRFGFLILVCLGLYQVMRRDARGVRRVLDCQLWLGMGLSALGIVQLLEYNLLHSMHLYLPATNLTYIASGGAGAVTGGTVLFRATGTFAEPSWLGYFLIPSLVLGVGRYLRRGGVKRFLICCLIALGLLATGSFSAFLLGGAVTGLLILRNLVAGGNRHRILRSGALPAAVVVVTLCLFVYVPQVREYAVRRFSDVSSAEDPSMTQRTDTMHEAVQLFMEHPVWGVGLGNYGVVRAHASDVSINSAAFLLLAETGLVGLLLFGAILASSVVSTFSERTDGAFDLRWVLLAHAAMLVVFNWWFHPLLWLNIAAAAALRGPAGLTNENIDSLTTESLSCG
jgi:O-antigen ligase